jgi:hypothetical protein
LKAEATRFGSCALGDRGRKQKEDIMRKAVLPLLATLLCGGVFTLTQERPYDLVISGGAILDGDGGPAVRADLAIRDGRIARIGDLRDAKATRRLDATGHAVAPGFIDIHNHSDFTILTEPKAESMIRQGVTTMVLGESRSAGPIKPRVNDTAGGGDAKVDWTTLGGYFGRLERQHMATNIASYVGEEQVWTYVKGYIVGNRRDEEARGSGDGGGCDGTVHFPPHAAIEPRHDRQPDRAGQSCETIRRHLLVAHSRRR